MPTVGELQRGSVFQRSDGTTITFPPDAVFSQVDPGASDVNLELTQTTQLFSIGTKLEDVWGRVFRYVEYGGTIPQASLVQAEGPDAVHDDFDLATAASAGDESISVASPATGSADFIVNEYAQGWVYAELVVSGIVYPIAKHAAWDISASDALTVYLFRAVRTAITTDCDLSFVKSKFKEVIVQPHSTPTGAVVGTNAGSGAVDGRFGWVQTRGPGKVLGNTVAGALLVGEMVTVGTSADGSVDSYNEDGSENLVPVGRLINFVDTTGEFQLVDLALE